MTGQIVYLDPTTACDAMERILIAIRNVRDENGLRCLCVIPEDYMFDGIPITEFFSRMLGSMTGDTYLWPQEYLDMVANFVPLEQRVASEQESVFEWRPDEVYSKCFVMVNADNWIYGWLQFEEEPERYGADSWSVTVKSSIDEADDYAEDGHPTKFLGMYPSMGSGKAALENYVKSTQATPSTDAHDASAERGP